MSQRRASALPVRDRGNALALAAALALVAAVRVLPLPTVYRAGDVVLSSNDPYFYRYWVELPGGVAALPEAVAHGEPLFVVAVRVVVALGPWSSGHVLAWYPVVSAVLTALLVYVLAVRLSDDERVGLAAVAFLAVTPAHAGRTGLGFADHHAFDYPWLVLTALAIVVLLQRAHAPVSTTGGDEEGDGSAVDWPWGWVGVLAAGVAGQVLAWDNAPLLVVPVGAAVGVVAPLAVRDNRLLWRGIAPCVVGVGIAAGVVALVHVGLGWHTAAVASAPALLFGGCLAVLAVTAVAARLGLDGAVLGAGLLFGAGVAALVGVSAPDVVPGLDRGLARLFGDAAIGETRSLVAPGAVVGPLMVLGFAPLFALPAGAWAVRRGYSERAPGWLVGATYLASFLALALVQRRFVGELAPFAALFAGVGFVAFLAWLGLTASPLPSPGSAPPSSAAAAERADGGEAFPTADAGTPATGAGVGRETGEGGTALVGGDEPAWFEREAPTVSVTDRTRRAFVGALGAVVLVPGAVYAGFLYDQSNVSPHAHAAARWMRAHADDSGWTYPENRVFAHWGRVRLFNYVVNGESASYAFAQRYYDDFVRSTDPEEWRAFLEGRVGFVVTRDVPGEFGARSLQRRLHDHLGSATGTAPGVASFRAVYASADRSVCVFTPVRGATIVGRAPADGSAASGDGPVAARTTASIASDAAEPSAFEYVARARRADDGSVAIPVGQPGTYVVSLGDEPTTVEVSERAVVEGATIEL